MNDASRRFAGWTVLAFLVLAQTAAVDPVALPAWALETRVRGDTLVIPKGTRVRVDGVAHPYEWTDAETLSIRVDRDWVITALIKHDGSSVCCAFLSLARGRNKRYPEILLDGKGDRGSHWGSDDWWLHASYHDCTSRGTWEVHARTCQDDAWGWDANSFPRDGEPATIEFRVSLPEVGIEPRPPGSTQVFGLALAVVNTAADRSISGNADESAWLRWYWPVGAEIRTPDTWALARLGASPLSGKSSR